jgi:outer membrane biosynthesis protein TonB
MMPLKCWRIGAIVGLTIPMVLVAANASSQQSGSKQGSQQAVPAKAVTDPDAPPPDDPQAQPLKRDDDLAPEPEENTAPKESSSQEATPPESTVPATAPAIKPESVTAPNKPAAALAVPTSSITATEQAQVRTKYDREAAELLSLVQDLKVEVEKAGSNTLSLAALRKADEIQRLAKDLKEKMRDQGGRVAAGKP